MKIALVSGASSGIGKAVSKKLLSLGYIVYGMARDFNKCDIDDINFKKIEIDLTHQRSFPKIDDLQLLINCAGIGRFAPFEELKKEDIENLIALNLTAPLLLSHFYLRTLKKKRGFIININSITAIEPAIFGAAYAASKAGLRHFGKSLFKEARKSGLKVVNINPNITATPFFDDLRFKNSSDPLSYIEANDIANIIENIISQREGTVITDITIEPQIFKIEKKSVKD